MKKILVGFLVLILSTMPVSAKENRLYFTESGDRLYYESKLVGDEFFMKHLDMVPGSKGNDTLIIENGTNTNYKLYFQVKPREQSRDAEELLENIEMKITLDGKEIYDGLATGVDYNQYGVNLQDAILLGDFGPKRESKMEVEVTLSKEYSNTSNRDISYIDWVFYGQYEDSDPSEIIKVPDTEKNQVPIMIVSGVIILIGVGAVLYAKKKEK